MDPSNKNQPVNKETVIQTYLNTLQNDGVEEVETNMEVLEIGNDEADIGGVTYFVDDEGHYYFQPAGDTQNIITLVDAESSEPMEQNGTQLLLDTEELQTVALMPTETDAGEMSYVLVLQEETEPVSNIDVEIDQQEKGSDVHTFNDKNKAKDAVTEGDEEPQRKSNKTKRLEIIKNKDKPSTYTCSFCGYTSRRRYIILRHMKTHSDERPYNCNICKRGFKTVCAMQSHMNTHNGVKPYICKHCNSSFTTSGELVRHVRYKHTHEKPHKCGECDYASVEISKLRRHSRCHTGERPYQCPHCTYASLDTFKLKRHLRTHTGEKPYKCDRCNMRFTQSNSLKSHKLTHSAPQRPVFSCELCPDKYVRKADLRMHVKNLHTSDNPLKCKCCSKKISDQYPCKIHNKTHDGEKCFKCNVCPYASETFRHLKSHMMKHTGEKPFSCDYCDQSFTQVKLLRRHENLFHDPDYVPKPPKEKTHICQVCKRNFAHIGNLIRHLAIHDTGFGDYEQTLEPMHNRQKVILPDKLQMTLDCNEEGNGDEDKYLKLYEEGGNELKQGEILMGDADEQYVILQVIQLEDDNEQINAAIEPQNGEDEEQNMKAYEMYDKNECSIE